MPIYMKFDGIDGEVVEKDHKGWIELSSTQWGASNSSTGAGGGGGAGKVSFSDLSISKRSASGSPKLFLACASGRRSKKVTIEVLSNASERLELVHRYTLTDVLVSSFGVSADGDSIPFEEAALKPSSIQFEHVIPQADGSVRIEKAFWDIKRNTGG